MAEETGVDSGYELEDACFFLAFRHLSRPPRLDNIQQ